jgi:SAM-dependent methyltransferase
MSKISLWLTDMTDRRNDVDFTQAQKTWVSSATKRSAAWGEEVAKSLWNNLYTPWIDDPNGRSFLDVGCSWGYLFKHMLDHCSPTRLIGVDIAPHWEGSPFAWEKETRAHITFHHGDVFSAPLADASFDYVLCASVLQYLPPTQLDKTIERIRQLLRPGGELLLRTQVFTSYLGLQLHRVYQTPYVHLLYGEDTIFSRLESAGRRRSGFTNWFTATSYLCAFTDAGFEILDVRRFPNQHAPSVQDRVLADFPASREEMTVSQLGVRLRRPSRFGNLERQSR